MKRLRRIIFNAVTVLSLLLFMATVGLWVRSYSRGDEITVGWFRERADRKTILNMLAVASRDGSLVFRRDWQLHDESEGAGWDFDYRKTLRDSASRETLWWSLGFHCGSFTTSIPEAPVIYWSVD